LSGHISVSREDLQSALASVRTTRKEAEETVSAYKRQLSKQDAFGQIDKTAQYLIDKGTELEQVGNQTIESLNAIERWLEQELRRLEEDERIKSQILGG